MDSKKMLGKINRENRLQKLLGKPTASDGMVEMLLMEVERLKEPDYEKKQNQLKGDSGKDGINGKDGYIPVQDKDYPSIKSVQNAIHSLLTEAMSTIKDGKDGINGKDGITPEITEDDINNVAKRAYKMIKTPDVQKVLSKVLQTNDIVPIQSVKGLDEKLKDLLERIKKAMVLDTGGMSHSVVVALIAEAIDGLESLPDQTGNTGKFLTTDGTDASWAALAGGGDMAAATYDPTGVSSDAFDVDNHVDGTTNKVYTATEKTKLTGVETSADVTDATNVEAAGAVMNTGNETVAGVKTFSSDPIVPDEVYGAGWNASNEPPTKNAVYDKIETLGGGGDVSATGTPVDNDFAKFTDGTTIEGRSYAEVRTDINVEDGADVTDTANVTSAGALMDSELTSIADVKALDQSVVSGATPTFTNTNFTEAANKNYVTDAEKVVIGNTSGTNTGDVTVADTAEIDMTLTGQEIKADIVASSIDETKLDASVNASLDLADSALQDLSDDTTPTLGGDLGVGENSIELDSTLSADETWSGITVAGTLGGTVALGAVVYLASDGKWDEVDGILDGTDTGFNKQLGICLDGGADTDATEILLYGKVRSAEFPAFTVGSPVYLSDTIGELTVTAPSTDNFALRIVGFGLSAEELMFNPSQDVMVYAS